MNFFKKKQHPADVNLKCPAEGCGFVADDELNLEKHIEWKHPGLKKESVKTEDKTG